MTLAVGAALTARLAMSAGGGIEGPGAHLTPSRWAGQWWGRSGAASTVTRRPRCVEPAMAVLGLAAAFQLKQKNTPRGSNHRAGGASPRSACRAPHAPAPPRPPLPPPLSSGHTCISATTRQCPNAPRNQIRRLPTTRRAGTHTPNPRTRANTELPAADHVSPPRPQHGPKDQTTAARRRPEPACYSGATRGDGEQRSRLLQRVRACRTKQKATAHVSPSPR
ncbi:hypothetical protein B0J12DRAFT_220232 [Macrophomina phaseolina]|uniref:Secreted protein n=1 Tax=Macrophomina phaseolina TaxID=35725 RepID=A0ABQ8G0I1_9PEZI|nr:hypothetical protein B0J12DRAFT_220232 [Macrophomina phaseolina]